MPEFAFDGALTGDDGATRPVHCKVQPPVVGGQEGKVSIGLPAEALHQHPPSNPCTVMGQSGATVLELRGVYWKIFPQASLSGAQLSLSEVELLHVGSLTITYPCETTDAALRIHLGAADFLRREASFVSFSDESHSKVLFTLSMPRLGDVQFACDWATYYHRDARIPGASIVAGFTAIVEADDQANIGERVGAFKNLSVPLSLLFRQAITVHGWTFRGTAATRTIWLDPLQPHVTVSAHEERGDWVIRPQEFSQRAAEFLKKFDEASARVQGLVHDISVAVAPHVNMRSEDRFVTMFSAFERVVEFGYRLDRDSSRLERSDAAVKAILEKAAANAAMANDEDSLAVSARLAGFAAMIRRPSVASKLESFANAFPRMHGYMADLWPVVRGPRSLREIRHSLAHGGDLRSSHDTVAVATWHLGILLERTAFVLLGLDLPVGLQPGSFHLRHGAKGWYDRNWWEPMSKN